MIAPMSRLTAGVVPGVIDDTARYAFTAGGCGVLALALHDHTHWPIWAVTPPATIRDGWCAHDPDHGAVHYCVQEPTGHLVDIEQAWRPPDLLARYVSVVGYPLGLARVSCADVKAWRWLELVVPLELARTFVAPVLARLA